MEFSAMSEWLQQPRGEEPVDLEDGRRINILTLLSHLVMVTVFGAVAGIGSVSWILLT
jgi:hypothetical protein